MKTMKPLPSRQRLRALDVLEGEELTPSEFAKLMWPSSDGWRHPTKCGPNGSHKGGGMYLSAGGFLAKLERAGLVLVRIARDGTYQKRYRLSVAGKKLLAKYGD
jgi:DNA-binding transcriptional ArsR family regulator